MDHPTREVAVLHAPIHRLFYAIRPPLTLARQVANAAHWFDHGGTVVRAEHLHVTLDILDDRAAPDPSLIDALLRAGAAVAAAPFTVTFDRVVGSPSSIALRPAHRIAGLAALCGEIARHRGGAGIAVRDGYRFNAHMTLGYRVGTPFQQPTAPIAWQADTFELVHSHVGRTRHDRIGRWPLIVPDPAQYALF